MPKLFSFNMMTLDGFFEGPDHDINWHNVDDEFNDFAIRQLESMSMIFFGRATYEIMASFWPTTFALENDPVVAGLMNAIPKAVFSRSLDKADWNNTRLIKDDIAGEIAKIKQDATNDIGIFGSANLIASLMPLNVIDEHRIMVNPVVLGAGTPLFKGANNTKLKLFDSRTFKSGNVMLTYATL